jgi:hypothetical protein
MRIGSCAATRVALLVALLGLAAAPAHAVADFQLDILQNGLPLVTYTEASAEFSCGAFLAGDSCTLLAEEDLGDLELIGITLDMNTIAGSRNAGFDAAVRNTSAAGNERFTFVYTVLNGLSFLSPTLTNGSADGGGSDGPGGGVFMQTVDNGNLDPSDDAFYAALIDGVVYDTLIPHPSIAQVPNDISTAFDHDEFGNQTFPDQTGPALASSIGITVDFEMSGGNGGDGFPNGDEASWSTAFRVVPEPGTALLLGLGLAGLASVGRRR